MLLDDMATLIDTQFAEWTAGTNLFISQLPEHSTAPDKVLAVFEYGGGAPQYMMGTGGFAIESPRIQVQVRDLTYSGAREALEDVRQYLGSIRDVAVNGTVYLAIQAVDTPIELQPDGKDRKRMSCNFVATKEPSA